MGIFPIKKVNENKIELCLCHQNAKPLIVVTINGVQVTMKPSINRQSSVNFVFSKLTVIQLNLLCTLFVSRVV